MLIVARIVRKQFQSEPFLEINSKRTCLAKIDGFDHELAAALEQGDQQTIVTASNENRFISNDAPRALDVKRVFADFRCLAFERANLYTPAELECGHVGGAAAGPHRLADQYGGLDHGRIDDF